MPVSSLTILIADDMDSIAEFIKAQLEILSGDMKFIRARNGYETYRKAMEVRPDLILLDWEMPEMSGIEFLESLDIIPQVIIYSSQEKYALESYEYDVTDYLLKPVHFGRFIKAVNRARERYEKKESPVKESTEIFIKNNGSLVRIKYDDILWIEALENYVVLNTFSEKYTIHFTMKAISDKMPTDKFMRIHRSFIVNFSKIKVIEDNSVVIMTENGSKVIPIGKSYRDKLMNDINLISK